MESDKSPIQAARRYSDDFKSPVSKDTCHRIDSQRPKTEQHSGSQSQYSSWVLSNLRVTDAEFEFLSLCSDTPTDTPAGENHYPSNEREESASIDSIRRVPESEGSHNEQSSGIDLKGGLDHAENNWVYDHMNSLINEIYSPVSGYALPVPPRDESRNTSS